LELRPLLPLSRHGNDCAVFILIDLLVVYTIASRQRLQIRTPAWATGKVSQGLQVKD
jgi:hypothetical protein